MRFVIWIADLLEGCGRRQRAKELFRREVSKFAKAVRRTDLDTAAFYFLRVKRLEKLLNGTSCYNKMVTTRRRFLSGNGER